MSKIKWKDVTGRSQRDPDSEIRSVEARVGQAVRVVVTRLHGIDDAWFMHLRGVNRADLELQAKDLKAAKSEAVERFRHTLKYLLQQLGEEVEEDSGT